MVGPAGLVATAATGISTATAVVTRLAARKERAKAEAAAKAAEALTAELYGRETVMRMLVGGAAAFTVTSVVGWWRAQRRVNELNLGAQVRLIAFFGSQGLSRMHTSVSSFLIRSGG